jgi:hypothetical protein
MSRVVACVLVAACGGVNNPVIDGHAADAPPLDAASDTSGANCMTENFDGTQLDARWSVLVGSTPTAFAVNGSRLLITDAPFAPSTPSMPAESWIYDLDTDKGNQIAWAQPIGGEDFTLTADLGWSSTLAELTLGGVAVSDAQGTIAALAGVADGSSGSNGAAYATLHVVNGPDVVMANPPQEPGTASVKIQRVNGMATLSINGVQAVTGAMPALISNVVIFYVRYKSSSTLYDFGSVEIRQIQLCRP